MKICVIDISQSNHPTLVEAIAQIYSLKEGCDLDIYANNESLNVLENSPFILSFQLHKKEANQSVLAFFKSIEAHAYHKIFIVTLEPNTKDALAIIRPFLATPFNTPIYYVVHNIDIWFWKNTLQKTIQTVGATSGIKNKLLALRRVFYNTYGKKIANKVIASNGKLVVLSDLLKQHLSAFVKPEHIVYLPFSLPDKKYIIDAASYNTKKNLHFTVPGIVTQHRRDYIGFLQAILNDSDLLQSSITIELLGKISIEDFQIEIEELISKIKATGFNLITHGYHFLTMPEYDKRMQNCDCIIALLNPVSQKNNNYGTNKESGFIYNTIKYYKPTLVPDFYPYPNNLNPIIISYSLIQDLIDEMKKLDKNRFQLQDLYSNTPIIDHLYNPDVFFNSLEGGQ